MRPRSLYLQGFTTFRSMAEPVSFLDADLFALTGPTGSGKTSMLDAMCFALYGKVPRLDARAVEPVISLGALQAKVAFEFSVGTRVFTAARVVQRTKTGASVREARLEEHIDEVVEVRASGADETSAEVAALLGLSFDQFTKAVLLPQGAFAAFLHDTPAKRQDLLRTLLDMDVYELMRSIAQLRKARSEGEADVLERELAALAHATAEAESEASRLVAVMSDTLAVVQIAQPEIDAHTAALDELASAVAAIEGRMADLGAVSTPADLEAIARTIESTGLRLLEAQESLVASTEAVDVAEKELAALPALAELVGWQHRWQKRAELVARVDQGRIVTGQARTRSDTAVEGLLTADAALAGATEALARIEARHQGHTLAERLVPGDECPVCLRPIESALELAAPEGLDAARRAHQVAVTSARAAADEASAAKAHMASCEWALEAVTVELATLDAALQGQPSAVEVAERHEQVTAADSHLERLRAAERSARESVDAAQRAVTAAHATQSEGRRSLVAARDRVAASSPPELGLDDLAADWAVLTAWAEARQGELRTELDAARRKRASIGDDLEVVRRRVESHLTKAGIEAGSASALERSVRAMADAEQRLRRVREDREAAAVAASRVKESRAHAELAKALARHLQANGFEGWLMEEALEALVAGANGLLAELSGGAYSLRMDKRDFSVVDHHNADETRGVRTLSGGETFLVSLALALSLADQIGAMATEGAARLESIFLDEGFGTLDGDTLDVVASVIQELGATGRTVGLVTHVRELAEMVPVRFEITRGPGGSTVSRVDV